MKTGHAPEIVVVRVKIVRGLMLGPVNFGLLDSRRNRADYARGHLVLQLENVLKRPVETIGPKMRAIACVDQLAGDAHLIAALAHGTFEDVTDTKLASYSFNIDRLTCVSEARIASDDEQTANARQCGTDLLDHAVGEILLLGIARHVLEGQHRDGRLVR